jgi:hypothetical protein
MVFGNEDDQTPTGDGTFSPDASNIGLGTLRLRNEHVGSGNGRVYLVVVKATDASGNVGLDCGTVVVPHDQTAASLALIETQATAAKAFCLANSGTPPPGYFVIGDGPVIGPKQYEHPRAARSLRPVALGGASYVTRVGPVARPARPLDACWE